MIEIIYEKYLKQCTSKVYIEAGAVDGIQQSNTKYLNDLDWTGILVEPNPNSFDLLAQNRDRAFIVNSALVSNDYPEKYIEGFFNSNIGLNRWAGQREKLLWRNKQEKRAWTKQYENAMCGQIKSNHNYDQKRFHSDENLISVPARSIDSILEEVKITDVDFFSLDIEGYEAEALKGWDPEKHKIKYVLMELADNSNKSTKILLDYGYEPVELFKSGDALYKKIN